MNNIVLIKIYKNKDMAVSKIINVLAEYKRLAITELSQNINSLLYYAKANDNIFDKELIDGLNSKVENVLNDEDFIKEFVSNDELVKDIIFKNNNDSIVLSIISISSSKMADMISERYNR